MMHFHCIYFKCAEVFVLGELGLSVRRAVASPEGDFEGDRAS